MNVVYKSVLLGYKLVRFNGLDFMYYIWCYCIEMNIYEIKWVYCIIKYSIKYKLKLGILNICSM